MFIHGGYWRALDKAEQLRSSRAGVFEAAGYAVAVINYDLAAVEGSRRSCAREVVWLVHQGLERGRAGAACPWGEISAGGHLTAMNSEHRD